MKTLFVKVLAMTVGVVVGLSLVGIGLYWFTHRWNSNSVTAKLIKYGIYERDDKPKEPHFYTQLYFDVTNNTSSDYTLPIKIWKDRLMESHTGSLIGSSGWEVSLVQGSMPYNIPSGFFDPKPIFIPAHTTCPDTIRQRDCLHARRCRGKDETASCRKSVRWGRRLGHA